MKRLSRVITRLVLVAMTLGLLWVATNASAERNATAAPATSPNAATVHIPFAFTVNYVDMPAGDYTVERIINRFLCFVDVTTGQRILFALINPEETGSIARHSVLIFHVNGGRHLLIEVQIAGSSKLSRLVVQPPLAEEMAMKESGKHPVVEIEMN